MTTLIGDLQSIMGTPFGGEGHAVLIFSRVSRAAFQSGAVITELHDRIPMPEEAGGRFTAEGLDPGPVRVELEGGTVHGHGWNVDLPEEGEWHLTDLMDAQVEWSPAVVGRAESAARDATQSFEKTRELRDETEGFRDETFQKADAALNDAANLVRGEFETLTDRAEAGASTATEQAGLAAGHAEQAGDDRAQTGADRRQTGEDRAQTGEDVEAAEQWAGQSKDAATLAITAAAAFEGHSPQQVIKAADRAEAASERVGTAAQIETWVGDAQEAADRAEADADRAEAAADTAVTGMPDGAVTRPKLAPDVVDELEGKADRTELPTTAADVGARPDTWTPTVEDVTDLPVIDASSNRADTIVQRDSGGRIVITPAVSDIQATTKGQVDEALAGKADTDHRHTADQIDNLDSALAGAGQTAQWSQVSGKPTTFPPDDHRHTADQIDNLDTFVYQRVQALNTDWVQVTGPPSNPQPNTIYFEVE